MDARNAGVRAQNQLGSGIGSRDDLLPVIASFREALDYARSVDDDVLDKIHPEIKTRWRSELERGIELRLRNLESPTGDINAEFEGSSLLDRFGDWWDANKGEIRIPKR